MRRFALLAGVGFALVSCSPDADPVAARRVVASPIVTPSPTPVPTAVLPAQPAVVATRRPPAPKARPARPVAPPPAAAGLDMFRGLGAWVDVFDIDDDPAWITGAVRDMASRGVRTLYLETSRFNHPTHISNPRTVAAAVDGAHAHGMRIVAWYPPDFVDLERDIARILAAVRYMSPGGGRFDAVGVDIERTDVADPAERNRRLLELSRRVREGAGAYPLAAIVISPTSLEVNPGRWPDFPWTGLAPLYDVFMPMTYWTYRRADAPTAGSLTAQNAEKTARLTGRPVHVIGGEAAPTDDAQATAYVDAALAGGSLGGGLYDYKTTTKDSLWPILRRLNR